MTPRTTSRHGSRQQAAGRQRPTARQWSVDFRRALRRHRRKLAVLATLAAVLTGLTALAPPQPPTVPVVTAARALSAGATIAADDLEHTDLPPDAVPDDAVTDPAALIGEKLAGPVPARQVLTGAALLRQRSAGRSTVVAPLPLADERVSSLLEAGDVVDVLAADSQTGKTRVVASAVRVVTGAIAVPDDTGASAGSGGLVLVEVSPDAATALAAAAATSVLSIVWH
jgi:pilus assembly protein CpaB